MGEEPAFLLRVRQGVRVVGWRGLDRLPRQIDRHGGIEPIDVSDPLRRDEHLMTEPPLSSGSMTRL